MYKLAYKVKYACNFFHFMFYMGRKLYKNALPKQTIRKKSSCVASKSGLRII